MNAQSLLTLPPKELSIRLDEEFDVTLPDAIISIEDMEAASKLLIKLSGSYSFLTSLLSFAKIAVRETKRSGDKVAWEDMVDRKDAIENKTNAVKQNYSAVSRAVTIHIENNAELRMNTGGYIRR